MEEKEKKVVVDQDKCFRCGFCVGNYPDKFAFGDEGAASVIDDTVTEEAEEAANACPAGAISIVEK